MSQDAGRAESLLISGKKMLWLGLCSQRAPWLPRPWLWVAWTCPPLPAVRAALPGALWFLPPRASDGDPLLSSGQLVSVQAAMVLSACPCLQHPGRHMCAESGALPQGSARVG